MANDTIYDNKPTYDRSVQAAYPPGSPFKLLTALAGYQMKVISDSTKFTCRHGYRMGRHTIGCHCGTFWPIGMEKAIEKSCNNYFSSVFIKSPKNTAQKEEIEPLMNGKKS